MQSWLWKVCYWLPRQCWLLSRGCFPVGESGSSFTKMCGPWYIFRGAGWCMTSVFLVLMVKPKLSRALEKWFTHCCISASVLLLRAQSSPTRSSLSDLCFCCEPFEVEHSSTCSVPESALGVIHIKWYNQLRKPKLHSDVKNQINLWPHLDSSN